MALHCAARWKRRREGARPPGVEVAASLAELAEIEGKPYREWLIPAAWPNARATVRNVSEQEIEDAERAEEEE
ncbi:MAG TPA: hypothetical protein VKM54_21205 [Myxococcota bacterium]|nr:hypothetical protein [Myxococcota bacterium]